jgi:AcrR family transcriptional regulator
MAYRETERTRAVRDERRAVLLTEASGLVAAGGFAAATVKAIAERSGMSVGSVYSYFDGRDELLAAVFRAGADRELDAVRVAVAAADGAAARLATLVRTFARRAVRGRRMAWSLLFEPVDGGIDAERLRYRARYHEVLHDILREGIATGVFPDQDVTVTASALNGAISEALLGRLSPDHTVTRLDESDDDLAIEAILRFCFLGVGFLGVGFLGVGRRDASVPSRVPARTVSDER